MKTFVVLIAVAAIASADIGLGYHYGPQKLQTSYETPSYSAASGSSIYNNGYPVQNTGSVYKGQTVSSGQNAYHTSAGLQNGYPSQVLSTGAGYQGSGYQSGGGYQTGTGYQSGSGYQTGSGYQLGAGYQSGTGYQTDNTKYQNGGNYAGGSGSSGNLYQMSSGSIGTLGAAPSTPVQSGYQGFNQYQSSSQYESNAANYQQYYSQVQQQPPQIFKHFYVHAAPEEPEVPRARQPVVLPAPQKHYKIIFIKTPAPDAGSTRFIPVQQQNEEKTIVYVLVKKPEEAEDVVLPQIEQKPPSKPEVYFIKYKGKEESQAVINNIVSEYNSGKGSVNVAGAVLSSGTLESISDTKYTSQSLGGSQSAGNVDAPSQMSSGSYESQYQTSGGSVGQSISSGSVGTGSSDSGYQSQSFGTSTASYPTSTAGYQTTAGPLQVTVGSGGYESNLASGGVSSSTASSESGGYGQVSSVSSGQGIPHETYGLPKFRDY